MRLKVDQPTPGGERRSFWADSACVIAVSLLFLAVLEFALHLCGVRLDASLFQLDPVRSYSFRPGASGWHTAENDIFVRINEEGNRDRPRALEPLPGTLRIAVLGSSTTAALEVEQQQTYTALLERALSRPGAPVEVLNFAVEGYGPAQDFYTLQDEVWRFHPQIVIDEVSLKQYVLNSTKKYSTTSLRYPYFQVRGESVVPDPSSQEVPRPTELEIASSNRLRSMLNSMDLILLVTEAKKQLPAKIGHVLSPHASGDADPLADPWRWTLIAPPNPEIAEGWKVVEGLMLTMRQQASAHNAEFWVVISDDAFQVNPDPKIAETLRRQMRVDNLDYGDDRFETFLSRHQVHHIHLKPDLETYVRQTGAYLHGGPKMPPGEGHWNVLGHKVVAEVVARDLEQESAQLQQWNAAHNPSARQSPSRPDLLARN